ncbi:MAG: rRNA maturation RNase YbeY [Rhodocyclaceae bacterium]|nr:rRNA maturation RNase YbeY [Rhodocyclaceae bacterium]
MHLVVQYATDESDLPTRPQLRRWLSAALEKPACVTLRFVSEAEGRTLNRDYRGKDYATNVLSFGYENAEEVCGDLVLCPRVARREAQEQGKPFLHHLAHLVIHGMLHLQGYDHERGARARRQMEAREREILARFRIPDPYV